MSRPQPLDLRFDLFYKEQLARLNVHRAYMGSTVEEIDIGDKVLRIEHRIFNSTLFQDLRSLNYNINSY